MEFLKEINNWKVKISLKDFPICILLCLAQWLDYLDKNIWENF